MLNSLKEIKNIKSILAGSSPYRTLTEVSDNFLAELALVLPLKIEPVLDNRPRLFRGIHVGNIYIGFLGSGSCKLYLDAVKAIIDKEAKNVF